MNSLRHSGKWLLLPALTGGLLVRFRMASVPVLSHPVSRGPITAEVVGTGTLEARVKTALSPRIEKRLAEVLVDQGDRVTVTNGPLLARLDAGELSPQVAVAEAAPQPTTEAPER